MSSQASTTPENIFALGAPRPARPECPAATRAPGDLRSEFSLLFRSVAEKLLASGEKEEKRLHLPGAAKPETEGRDDAGTQGVVEQVLMNLLAKGADESLLKHFMQQALSEGMLPSQDNIGSVPQEILSGPGRAAGFFEMLRSNPAGDNPRPEAHPAVNRISNAVISMVGGRGRMVVRLHPPQLGTVWIKVSSAGEMVRVEIKTNRAETQSLLLNGAGQMRRRLEAAGVSVDRFDVTSFENRGRGGREQRRSRREGSGRFHIPGLEETG